jgi:hypothetical protein
MTHHVPERQRRCRLRQQESEFETKDCIGGFGFSERRDVSGVRQFQHGHAL